MLRSDFVRVCCQSERYALDISLSASVATLKSMISARHHFDPGVRLVFNGRLLNSLSTLTLSGITTGSLIVAIPPKSEATLRIIPWTASPFDLPVHLVSSVTSLRESVALHLGLLPDQINLVHNGRILEDNYSLSNYELFDKSAVYVAKCSIPARANPSQLIATLRNMISRFVAASSTQQRRLAVELADLISNPVLTAFAPIDPNANLIIDDAKLLLESAESSDNAQMSQALAAVNDQMMTAFEVTASGMRLLWETVEKENRKRERQPPAQAPTRTDFEPSIAEKPLPIWWSPWTDGNRAGRSRTSNEKFSREIRALKRMGFDDESVILMALKETSGNVKRAAKLLMGNVPNRCA
jgi:hypothetical protein